MTRANIIMEKIASPVVPFIKGTVKASLKGLKKISPQTYATVGGREVTRMLEVGTPIANKMGIKAKPNEIDKWFAFGFPATAVTYKHARPLYDKGVYTMSRN